MDLDEKPDFIIKQVKVKSFTNQFDKFIGKFETLLDLQKKILLKELEKNTKKPTNSFDMSFRQHGGNSG